MIRREVASEARKPGQIICHRCVECRTVLHGDAELRCEECRPRLSRMARLMGAATRKQREELLRAEQETRALQRFVNIMEREINKCR